MEPVIREVEPGDWELLREVRLRALAESPSAFLTTLEEASAWSEEHWRERARPADGRVSFVAESGGRVAGTVSAFVGDDPRTVFLVSLWVDPAARGAGVGAGLVERVVDWARGREAERVCLAVAAGNDRAARLYERCAFVRPEVTPPFPWHDPDGTAYERRL